MNIPKRGKNFFKILICLVNVENIISYFVSSIFKKKYFFNSHETIKKNQTTNEKAECNYLKSVIKNAKVVKILV